MNSITTVQLHIEKIISHLEPLLPLTNCHMVDFFTKNIFRNYLSLEMQNEINSISCSQAIQNIFAKNFENVPNIYYYLQSCEKCTLLESKATCMNLEECYRKLETLGCTNINSLKLDIFMSQKKSHEVEVLSSIVAALKEIGNTTHVIDIGDGKGYLSSMLSLHHKIPVLGIDASAGNTNAANKRVQKLERVWHSIYDNPKKSLPKKTDCKFTSSKLYKQVTQFVHPHLNFNEVLSNAFSEKVQKISLTGLHTCGNLASTSIKIFIENDYVKTLANVGCCYHLLDEKFEHQQSADVTGFPMSNYLINKKFSIGRNARMVAAQSVNRVFDKKELPDISIFYRALLQVFLQRLSKYPTKTVGKMRKKCSSFTEYAKIALQKLEIDVNTLNIVDEDLENLYNEYKPRLDELNLFYLLRCMNSSVIESLILLDRLLLLLEQGYNNSFLVQLFDPVVSPRCYGVLSLKL